jgi:hypothetical protein
MTVGFGLSSHFPRFSSFPVFISTNSAYDIYIFNWEHHHQIPRRIHRRPTIWRSVSSFCDLRSTLSLFLPVISKPYQLWGKGEQNTILPLRLIFSIGWSFEMCVHPLDTIYYIFQLVLRFQGNTLGRCEDTSFG